MCSRETDKPVETVDAARKPRVLKHAGLVFWVIVTALPILGIIFSVLDPVRFYSEQEEFQAFAKTYGIYGPIAFIIMQILQVVFTPISHYSVGYMGGFLYGTYYGSLYNWIGRIIGHAAAFSLSRTLGRRLALRYVQQKTLDKYDRYVSGRYLILFLIYFLPLFPDDEISYLAGLSKMRFRWFLLANLFGHVGGSLSLAYLGNGVDTKDALFWVLTIVTLAGFPLIWFLMRKRSNSSIA